VRVSKVWLKNCFTQKSNLDYPESFVSFNCFICMKFFWGERGPDNLELSREVSKFRSRIVFTRNGTWFSRMIWPRKSRSLTTWVQCLGMYFHKFLFQFILFFLAVWFSEDVSPSNPDFDRKISKVWPWIAPTRNLTRVLPNDSSLGEFKVQIQCYI
jgi:hypothetical protein